MTSESSAAPATSTWRTRSALQRAYRFLVSPRLAIALLVGILACCVAGVTAYSPERAWRQIFSALWFNGLLVLLAVSAGAAFFSRIWKRKLTLVSVGMILFHLSFMALLGGVVYKGLFSFKGVMRLTEGETLPNNKLESYDQAQYGRFFDLGRLRGETTLLRMHRDFTVRGDNKWVAYEIEVADGGAKTRGAIYVTEYLVVDGLRFFVLKEGYSVLVILSDRQGQEIYGGHVPLQSIRQPDGSRLYATGSAMEAGGFPFPAPPEAPRFDLQVIYWPSTEDRKGQVAFQVKPLEGHGPAVAEKKGMVPVGEALDAGDIRLTPREIRYWVGMDVHYDPAWGFIMGSFGFGLLGMTLTLVGRLRQGPRKRAA